MTRSGSLLPREHGVYAELGFPVVTGMLVSELGLAPLAFAATIVLGVLVHEPVAILSGRRGRRLQDALGQRARRRASTLVVLMAATGVTALLASPPAARRWALVPLGFALLLVPAVVTGRAKTLWGELLVVAALASSVLPMTTAGGVAWTTAMAVSGVWFASFMVGTVTVHGVKARHHGGPGSGRLLAAAPALSMAMVGGGLLATRTALVSPAIVVALLPPVLVALAISVAGVHPRNLRRVGWSLVGANILTMVVLLLWL